MASIEDIIKKVPVYVELDRPEERIYAIQALYRQLLNVMDVIKSGGGGGATKLSELEDVNITSPEEGQVLKYSSNGWINHIDDGTIPAPDSVGTEQIIDNSVEMDDLNDSVKEKIQKTYVEADETLHMDYDIAGAQAIAQDPIVVEEEEEP